MEDFRKKLGSKKHLLEEQNLSDSHLERFEDRLDEIHSNSFSLPSILKYAAAIMLPIGFALVFFYMSKPNESIVAEVETLNSKEAYPLAEAELYFKQTISEKQEDLSSEYTDSRSKAIIEDYQGLIKELEEQYVQLEEDLAISGDERIVVAMITNYKTRIQLLEELVLQLNYINNLKNNTYENPNA